MKLHGWLVGRILCALKLYVITAIKVNIRDNLLNLKKKNLFFALIFKLQ